MFGGSSEREHTCQDQRLLDLFFNRAQIKREVVGLRRERLQLLDALEDRDARITRANEQLQGLERILTIPHAAANAMVYFQLRHLWAVASQRLADCALQLETEHMSRERRQLHDIALARRGRRLDAVDEYLAGVKARHEALATGRRELEIRLSRWRFLPRWLRSRKLRRRLEGLERGDRFLVARTGEFELLKERIHGESLPEPAGLSVEARRAINAASVALAQQLVIHFSEHGLMRQAKAATECAVGDMAFGNRAECDHLVALIQHRVGCLGQYAAPTVIRKRLRKLGPALRYAGEAEVVPMPECVASIEVHDLDAAAATRRVGINVLSEDYWGLLGCLR